LTNINAPVSSSGHSSSLFSIRMQNSNNASDSADFGGRWVSYREEIKVLDCTIRDGGLMNDSNFDDATVKAVYRACVEGGIDYMEIGYKASRKIFAPDKYGAWRFCSENDLRRIVGDNDTPLKIAVMADAEKTDYHHDILPRDQSVIDMVRVATYVHQIPAALDMIKDANDKGYETCVNLMSVSNVPVSELDGALGFLAASEARAIYLVDSFGALYSEQVDHLVAKYLGYAKAAGKDVGIHMHNNLQLAFSNTIQGIIKGANFLDATMAGLGRGAGNCPMELLIRFLHNPKYNVRPILHCIQEAIEPMREKLGWGFSVPYMLTGFMNRHPRAAIKWNASPDKNNLVSFYDQILVEEA
jgi:4-hydroxy 2-oxovalerate aldolase